MKTNNLFFFLMSPSRSIFFIVGLPKPDYLPDYFKKKIDSFLKKNREKIHPPHSKTGSFFIYKINFFISHCDEQKNTNWLLENIQTVISLKRWRIRNSYLAPFFQRTFFTTGRNIGSKCPLNIFFSVENPKKIGKKNGKKKFQRKFRYRTLRLKSWNSTEECIDTMLVHI